MFNRYSLCKNLCQKHRHLLVHGSRKDFFHWQYKRCHLLRPDPTSNRHSRHGSSYGLPSSDHRVFRLQHSKEYFDYDRARQTDWRNHSKRPFGYSMFFEHQSIGVRFGSCNHIQNSLSSNCRSSVPFLHRYHFLHKFRQQVLLSACPTGLRFR